MRTLYAAAFVAALSPAFGQEPTRLDTAHPYERVEVVKLDSSRTADDLYRLAKRWFVDAFRDAGEVIQLDDPTTHTIVGKGNFPFQTAIHYGSAGRAGIMRFSVEIIAKPGRYRVRFYDYVHEGKAKALPSINHVAQAIDLGLIYNDQRYCMHYFNTHQVGGTTRNNPIHTPTDYGVRVCLEEVWPQIRAIEIRLLASIKEAMSSTAVDGSNGNMKSDW